MSLSPTSFAINGGRYVIMRRSDLPRASAAQRERVIEPRAASRVFDGLAFAPCGDQVLTGIYRDVVRGCLRPNDNDASNRMCSEVLSLVESGALVVIGSPARPVLAPLPASPESGLLGPDPEDDQDVEFDFEYEDATPVPGLGYQLIDPANVRTRGTLGSDGVVKRTHVSGRYAVALREVDLVEWKRRTARFGDSVDIVGRATGFDDGTLGEVRVYRLFDEARDRAVATLPVTLQDGRVDATWRCEPPAKEQGLARFVAELSFDGGRVWKKSDPVDIELPTIESVSWSSRRARSGDEVQLSVRTLGFTPGAEVAVSIHRHRPGGDDKKVADLPAPKLAPRVTQARLRCGGDTLPSRPTDVYALVTIKEHGVERRARSSLMWIDTSGAHSTA
jgi:hypothetical protein